MPGIPMLRRTTSGKKAAACSIALEPSWAMRTSWPLNWSIREKLDFPRGNAADVEEIVAQPYQVDQLPLHHLAHLADRLRAVPLHFQNLKGVPDRRQRVAQFVGQHGQELVFVPGGGFHLLVLPPQRLFGLPALRYVPRDLGEAAQGARFILERRDDHAGPEAGAVLAHPPPLLFVFP